MQTDTDETQTDTDGYRQSDVSKRLISLINKEKQVSAQGSVYQLVKIEFDSIAEARKSGVSWREIAEACEFSGKESQMRNAFRLENSRRTKKEKEAILGIKVSRIPEKLKTKNEKSAVPNRPAPTIKKIGDPWAIESEPEPLVKRTNFNFKECQINEGD